MQNKLNCDNNDNSTNCGNMKELGMRGWGQRS